MTDTSWLTDNWPWWIVIFFLLVYEGYALATKRGRTLSRMVWTSLKKYPWAVPISLSVLVWLLLHFYVTHGAWAIELPVTGVIITVIWMIYFAWKRKVVQ